MKGEYPIRTLCELLHVARGGYYHWRAAGPTARQNRDASLALEIAAVHRTSRGNYGAPRIVAELHDRAIRISRRRCARLMRAQRLRGRKRQRRSPRTTDSRHGRAVAENLLRDHAGPTGPDQVWLTDITYVRTGEGWLYVAAILDAWSRRIVGWACRPTLHTTLVAQALHSALLHRRPSPGLLHHSDRGSQYVDTAYQKTLADAGLRQSMSRAGNCYDNAMMESFWSTLKTETGIETTIPSTQRAATLAVFDYIATFYNPTRRHSSLGYLSPVAFEQQHPHK